MSSVLLWALSAYGVAAVLDLVVVTCQKQRRFGEGLSDFGGSIITSLIWPVDIWFRLREAQQRPRHTLPTNSDRAWQLAPTLGRQGLGSEEQSETSGLVEVLDTGYRTTLDRIRAAGDPSQRSLVETFLTDQASAVREAGLQKMALTARDGREHSVAWTVAESVMIGVQTVPATREDAASWYTSEFNGYLGYVRSVITPLLEASRAGVFVHVIFGQDKVAEGWQPWTSVAFLPARPGAVAPLLPRTCCNQEERARYGLR